MALIHFAEDYTSQISEIISPNSRNSGGLYLGNKQAIKNINILNKYKINAVISILSEVQVRLNQKNISHVQIKIDDSPFENISRYFDQCLEFIQKNLKTGNVFVHCVAGISRSATIIIAYLMKSRKYSLKYASSKVKARRNKINPNKGFVLQLQDYQKKLQKKYGLKLK